LSPETGHSASRSGLTTLCKQSSVASLLVRPLRGLRLAALVRQDGEGEFTTFPACHFPPAIWIFSRSQGFPFAVAHCMCLAAHRAGHRRNAPESPVRRLERASLRAVTPSTVMPLKRHTGAHVRGYSVASSPATFPSCQTSKRSAQLCSAHWRSQSKRTHF
jgi:hypothetical protein